MISAAVFGIAVLFAGRSDEIRIFSSNGARAALEELRPLCEKAIGRPIAIEFGTSSGLESRIEAGEEFDAAILTSEVIDELAGKGKILGSSRADLARSGIGVGVRRGAPHPDIGTPEALKEALLAAPSITYARDGASRIHIEAMLERMRIAEEIGSKTVLEQGSARAMSRVAEGGVELVLTLLSELLPTPGIEVVGALPPEHQYEVVFRAGVSSRSRSAESSRALILFLTGHEAARTFRAKGMEPQLLDRFVQGNGLRIHYLDWGSDGKQPLLLLHGIGRVAHNFDHVVSHFTERYHVIAVDLRGHGDSDWNPQGAYLVEDYVKDVEKLVEVLSLSNIVLWGNSTGGRVAQVYAGSHPDRVAAVIVEDVGPERPREVANNVTTRIRKEDETGWESEEALLAELKAANPRTADEVLRSYAHYGSKKRADGRIIWKRDPAIAKGFVPTQLWQYVRQIKSPILYVLGGRSTIVPSETQQRLREALPQVQIVTMPELGHYPSEENPEEYLAIVDRFLAEAGPSSSSSNFRK